MSLDVIDLARENDINLFCLPPHTTHALQPLDVSVFKSLKSHFSKAVHSLSLAKRDFVVTKRDFARVVKTPFERAFNIKAGFAKCGVYPFDPKAIDESKTVQGSTSSSESDLTVTPSSCASLDELSCSLPSSDISDMPSVNLSPIVSPLSSQPAASPHTSSPVTTTAVVSLTITPPAPTSQTVPRVPSTPLS